MINEKNIELKDVYGDDAKFANRHGWSDINPVEIVKVISDKTLEVREMDAERDPSWKMEVIEGGFFGHVVNDKDQKWFIKANPDNDVFRIRKSKSGVWKNKWGARFVLSSKARKFYDNNF